MTSFQHAVRDNGEKLGYDTNFVELSFGILLIIVSFVVRYIDKTPDAIAFGYNCIIALAFGLGVYLFLASMKTVYRYTDLVANTSHEVQVITYSWSPYAAMAGWLLMLLLSSL